MSWVDYVIIVLAVAGMAIQAKRGFLQSAFDFAASIIAIIGARVISPLIPALSPGVSYAIVGGVLLVALLFVSRLCYAGVGLTVESLDPVLGAFFGVLLALSLGYGISTGLTVANEDKMPDSVANSKIAYQVVTMQALKGISDMIFSGPGSDPSSESGAKDD